MKRAFAVIAFVAGPALVPTSQAAAAATMSDADVEFLADLSLRGLKYDHPKVRGAAASTLVSLPRIPDRARKGLLELFGSPKAREKCVLSVAYVLARQGAGVVPDVVALARRGDAEALKAYVEALLRAESRAVGIGFCYEIDPWLFKDRSAIHGPLVVAWDSNVIIYFRAVYPEPGVADLLVVTRSPWLEVLDEVVADYLQAHSFVEAAGIDALESAVEIEHASAVGTREGLGGAYERLADSL